MIGSFFNMDVLGNYPSALAHHVVKIRMQYVCFKIVFDRLGVGFGVDLGTILAL